MNKKEFLYNLRCQLSILPEEEIEGILQDYNMHIDEQLEEGQNIEEILVKLGNPKDIAKEYIDELGYINQSNNTKVNEDDELKEEAVNSEPIMIRDKGSNNNNVIIFIVLQFINLFVLAGFIFGIVVAVFSVGVTGVGLALGSFGVLAFNKSAEVMARVFKFFIMFGVGTLLFNGALGAAIAIAKLLIKYVKWNLSFIA